MTANDIVIYMQSLQNDKQRSIHMRFFKTAKPSDYGFGDKFLGIKVPQIRIIAKQYRELPLEEIPELVESEWHEVRMCGFLILVDIFERHTKKRFVYDEKAISIRDEALKMYIEYAERANNWDLVDLSAPKILGHWLMLPTKLGSVDGKAADNLSYKTHLLDSFANSTCLWKQRMSIVCTWKTTQSGDASWCLKYAEKLLSHPHDLIHKAVGWMLRDVGKNIDIELLRNFLEKHSYEMPRTMLRYAIEKMTPDERDYWMKRKNPNSPAKR